MLGDFWGEGVLELVGVRLCVLVDCFVLFFGWGGVESFDYGGFGLSEFIEFFFSQFFGL